MGSSASASLSTSPLTNAERVDVRRFCGYPSYGQNPSSFQGSRYFQAYGVLEFYMTNMAAEELQVTRQFLSDLYTLEQAIPAAGAGLNVAQASVFTRNPREIAERKALYRTRRSELCSFMGVPPGPALSSGGSIVI